MAPIRTLGIMSGTSGDGIDAVLLELDSVHMPHRPRLIASAQLPFSAALTHELVHARSLSVPRLTELSFSLPRLYAEAVRLLPEWQTASCCGVHGQTITHQVQQPAPAPRGTWQIGSSAVLAQELNLPVVGDLRAMDVALGGQGAPIVPFAHWFFLGGGQQSAIVVNLGGICNASIITPTMNEVTGFDVGPGMMVSDAFAKRCSQGALTCDLDGQLSRGGRRIEALHAEMLAHPFVARATPKSAGREEFGADYYGPLLARYADAHSPADVMHTLLCATTDILARTVAPFLPAASRVVLTGGGARNPNLQALMGQAFAPLPVVVETEGVLAPQNHEPAAMALIAARTLHRLPSALPRVTGADYGAALGHIVWPTPVAARVRPACRSREQRNDALAAVRAASAAVTQTLLDTGAATAVSLHVQQRGTVLCEHLAGHAQRYAYDAQAEAVAALAAPVPLTPECRFDLASLTKVLATTAAVMALVSDGRLALHARAAVFLPTLAGTDKETITVDQLLRHRSGLAPWAPLYLTGNTLQAAVAAIAATPLRAPPHSARIYSDLGFILLGAIVEAVAQEGLDAYLQRRIATPLGLATLGFCPGTAGPGACVATGHGNGYERRMIDDPGFGLTFANKGHVASTQFGGWRNRTLVGEVNDGNAHHAMAGVAGHAGLFATATDVATLAAAMTGASPLFAADVVRDMLIPQEQLHYPGWANPSTWPSLAEFCAPLAELGCVMVEGFTGGLVACYPNAGITAVLLCNRQHQAHARAEAPPSLDAFRRPWLAALTAYATV